MNFEDIKKIVDKEGKVVIIENQEAYIVSKYITKKEEAPQKEEIKEEKEGLRIEDLPF